MVSFWTTNCHNIVSESKIQIKQCDPNPQQTRYALNKIWGVLNKEAQNWMQNLSLILWARDSMKQTSFFKMIGFRRLARRLYQFKLLDYMFEIVVLNQ